MEGRIVTGNSDGFSPTSFHLLYYVTAESGSFRGAAGCDSEWSPQDPEGVETGQGEKKAWQNSCVPNQHAPLLCGLSELGGHAEGCCRGLKGLSETDLCDTGR